ncbi:MAG: DUF4432 family protein [Clostridiaceae bacterium]|nr:DUF4432 family protein [Clostridiaceae bacterium]
MRTEELKQTYEYTTDLTNVVGIKDYTFNSGYARGMRALELYNGNGLRLTILPDRCLDIPWISYKDCNIGYLSRAEVRAPWYFEPHGNDGFLRQFFGGFITTCGVNHAGNATTVDGHDFPLHGWISNLPADEVCAYVDKEGSELELVVRGTVVQSQALRERMVLNREWRVSTETGKIRLRDEIENMGVNAEPLKMLYHTNFGWPLLDAGAEVWTNAELLVPRTAESEAEMHYYNRIDGPLPGRPEANFALHGESEIGWAALYNPRLGMAAVIRHRRDQLPEMNQWKKLSSGDYVLGLEPLCGGVFTKRHPLRYLEVGETAVFELEFEFTDSAEQIEKLRQMDAEQAKNFSPVQ